MSGQRTEARDRMAELPPLAEAMSARDLDAHVRAVRRGFDGGADVLIRPGCLSVYPGSISKSDGQFFRGETWPEMFEPAYAWIANHATVHRDARIRAMALAIIDLTDQHGRCDRAMLTRREFSAAEVDALKDEACKRAGELAGNAPFSVEG